MVDQRQNNKTHKTKHETVIPLCSIRAKLVFRHYGAQMDALTNTQMSKVLNQCPAVVINAVVLQNEQLADIPGNDVTWNLHSSAAVVLAVYFDHLPHRNPFISQ